VTDPDQKVLNWLSTRFSIKASDLERCIKEQDPPSGYRYAHYLVLRSDQIQVAATDSPEAHASLFLIICGDDFLITISHSDLDSIERVWQEVRSPELDVHDKSSSNALATRIIGASLHANELAVQTLSKGCEQFADQHGARLPSKGDLDYVRNTSRNLALCRRVMEGYDNVLDRLQEKKNLFGEAAPREALPRYHGIARAIRDRIEHTRQEVGDLTEAWNSMSAKWQNDILFKLAALSGACTPVALASGIFGMNFSSVPSDLFMVGTLACSAILSGALVLSLISRKYFAEN
jgi:Mg2+ and Co2+ transporter CorA